MFSFLRLVYLSRTPIECHWFFL